jgi:hypothetical protein
MDGRTHRAPRSRTLVGISRPSSESALTRARKNAATARLDIFEEPTEPDRTDWVDMVVTGTDMKVA